MIETSDMQFDSRMVTAEETPEDHDVEVTLKFFIRHWKTTPLILSWEKDLPPVPCGLI